MVQRTRHSSRIATALVLAAMIAIALVMLDLGKPGTDAAVRHESSTAAGHERTHSVAPPVIVASKYVSTTSITILDAVSGKPVSGAVLSGAEPVQSLGISDKEGAVVTTRYESPLECIVEHPDYVKKRTTVLPENPKVMLWPRDVLCGYVRDPSGRPVSQATVHIRSVKRAETWIDVGGPFGRTDQEGRFCLRITDADKGAMLTTQHDDFLLDEREVPIVSDNWCEILLEHGFALKVLLSDMPEELLEFEVRAGSRFVGRRVSPLELRAKLDSRRITIATVPRGTCQLTVRHGADVILRKDALAIHGDTTVDVEVATRRQETFMVVVRDPTGSPVAQAHVEFARFLAQTDAHGNATVRVLESQTAPVRVWRNGFKDHESIRKAGESRINITMAATPDARLRVVCNAAAKSAPPSTVKLVAEESKSPFRSQVLEHRLRPGPAGDTDWVVVPSGRWNVLVSVDDTAIVRMEDQWLGPGSDNVIRVDPGAAGALTIERMPDGRSRVIEGDWLVSRTGVERIVVDPQEAGELPATLNFGNRSGPILVAGPKTLGLPLRTRRFAAAESVVLDGLLPGWWGLQAGALDMDVHCRRGGVLQPPQATEDKTVAVPGSIARLELLTIADSSADVIARQRPIIVNGQTTIRNFGGRTLAVGHTASGVPFACVLKSAFALEAAFSTATEKTIAVDRPMAAKLRIVLAQHARPLVDFGGEAPILYECNGEDLSKHTVLIGAPLQVACVSESTAAVKCKLLLERQAGVLRIEEL